MSHETFLNKTKHTGRKLFLYLTAQKHGLDVPDSDAFALLVAVMAGFGAAWYFVLGFEPSWSVTGCLTGALMLLAVLMIRLGGRWWRIGWLLVALGLGFVVAQAHITARIPAQHSAVFWPTDQAIKISGHVESVTQFPDGQVLMLRPTWIERDAQQQEIGAARLYWRAGQHDDSGVFRPGDVIAGTAMLSPQSGPYYPGGYDSRLKDFFDGTTVRGYFIGLPMLRDELDTGFWGWIGAIRQKIEQRLHVALPGAAGGFAAALITGNQSAIPPEHMTPIRNSGLAHLLSISGIHMALVGGLFFVLVRRVLLGAHLVLGGVGLSFLAMRRIAAVVALLAGGGYLLLAGASVPAIRSYIALLLVIVGILMDRDVVNFRMLAVAMMFIVLTAPIQVGNPGALMSFLSVVALVGFFRWWHHSPARTAMKEYWLPPGFLGRAMLVPIELGLTSIIAGAATWPIALAYFGTSANYAILSNMVAVPIASFWVMPAGVAGLMMMPFGMDGIFWTVMGWGLDVIFAVAEWVAALPGAVILYQAVPDFFLFLVVVVIISLSLGRGVFGIGVIAALILMIGLVLTPSAPIVFVSMRDQLYGVVVQNQMVISDRKTTGRRARAWQQATGTSKVRTLKKAEKDKIIQCDGDACVAQAAYGVLAFGGGLGEDDCQAANWLLSFRLDSFCADKNLMILATRAPGWHQDAITAIRFDDNGRPIFQHTAMPTRPWQ